MEKYTLILLVANRFGVLTKVTGVFGRRGCNIHTLTAAPTDGDPTRSRVVIEVLGEADKVRQIYNQLQKLEDVADVSLTAESVE